VIPSQDNASAPRVDRWAVCLVAAATAATFLAVVTHPFVSWDDGDYLVRNPHFRGLGWANLRWMFTTAHLGHYVPVTWLTFGLDAWLWGVNPHAFHAMSLVLHCANAALLYLLAWRLLDSAAAWSGGALRTGAAAAALLWALHPLRVEPVAWATARPDLLAGLFALLTVLTYLRAWRLGRDGRLGHGWWLAAAVLFLVALLAKSVVVTLPFVLLVLDVYPLGRHRDASPKWRANAWRLVAEKWPLLVLAAGAGALMLVIGARQEQATSLELVTGAERVAIALRAAAFYVWKTVLPRGLSPFYELRLPADPWSPPFVAAATLVAGFSALALAARRRCPAALAGWISYLILLLPVSGLFQKGVPIAAADRYAYLATIPLGLLAGAAVAWCADAAKPGVLPLRPRRVAVAVAAMAIALAALSMTQVRTWRDSESLWHRALAVDPDSAFAHYHLAGLFVTAGRTSEARAEYERGLAVLGHRVPRAEAMFRARLGSVLQAQGEVGLAEQHYRQAIRLYPRNLRAQHNLAVILSERGDDAEALAHALEALRLGPDFPEVCANARMLAGRLGTRPAELDSCPTDTSR